ncbi:MAG: GrpB family protein [Acidobacteriales bacterium]|nr:GrpB family protein [Terriglobales bacterium]
MPHHQIVIVDYDPRWPGLYEDERARILDAVGPLIAAIEHVGSTSVPGLAAKSVIDIMVGVSTLADADHCIEPIERLGYRYVPEYEDEIPGRRFFKKLLPDGMHTHHIHVVKISSPFWDDHLLFRDYLRAHPDTAWEYECVKRALAPHFSSGNDYANAKTNYITEVLEKARAWQSTRR